MREILFRGKMENGAWICGTYFPPVNTIIIHKNTPDKNGVDTYKDFAVIPETVGQFTGLTDKNGKKIFEGDIVKAESLARVMFKHWGAYELADKEPEFKLYQIKYNEGKFQLFTLDNKSGAVINHGQNGNANTLEVVGNIHDNPELLEGEQI